MQNRLPIDLIQALKKSSIQFYLLVGGTVLLLAWLSVGLTPSTWGLLFQVIGQFKVLWAQSGVSVVWALLTLIGQSLLLLAAWVLLVGIIVRGSARFQAVQPVLSQSSVSPSVVAATALASPPARTVIENAQTVLIPSDRAFADQAKVHGAPPTVRRIQIDEEPTVVAPPRPVRTTPRPSSVQPAQAAQTDRIEEPTVVVPPRPVRATPRPSSVQPAQAAQTDRITEMATQITPLSSPDIQQFTLQKSSDPYAPPPGQQTRLKRPKWRSDDLSSDPFAPHEDILASSLQENSLLPTEDRPEQTQQTPSLESIKPEQAVGPVPQVEQSAPANKKEDGFVFGNPFEGVLPDVFEHDEDLKRSLKEQNSGSYSIDKAHRAKKQP